VGGGKEETVRGRKEETVRGRKDWRLERGRGKREKDKKGGREGNQGGECGKGNGKEADPTRKMKERESKGFTKRTKEEGGNVK